MAADFDVTVTDAELDTNSTVKFYDPTTPSVTVQLIVKSVETLPINFPDVKVYVEDKDGFPLGSIDYEIDIEDDTSYRLRTPKVRRLTVGIMRVTNARTVGKIILTLSAFTTPDPTVPDDDNTSKEVVYTILLVERTDPVEDPPTVVSIQRLRFSSQTVVSAFEDRKIAPEPFDVRIVLTEKPHDFKLDHIHVENGTASNLVVGVPFGWLGGAANDGIPDAAQTLRPHPNEGQYTHNLPNVLPGVDDVPVPLPTGDDKRYHQYRVTITPHRKTEDFTVKISINAFHDGGSPARRFYIPLYVAHKPNGREQLRIDVEAVDPAKLLVGYKVTLDKDIVIPAGGYLVITNSTADSEVVVPPESPGKPNPTHRTPVELIYNVVASGRLPNLATQFRNGVVVDVQSQHRGLIISEVMWGEDVSLATSSNSQWIELYNPGRAYTTVDDADHTLTVNEALTLIFYASNEFDAIPARRADGTLPTGITDRIGTLDDRGAYWNPSSKGQNGRTGTGEFVAVPGGLVPTVDVVSMYRVFDADAEPIAGNTAAAWNASAPPGVNFDPTAVGVRVGTPGAAFDATETPADIEAEEKAAADAAKAAQEIIASTGTIPQDGRIYISEIMFTGDGTVPQWIEIANGSRTEQVNLSGWTLTVDNAAADADVSIRASATFTIPDGTTVSPSGQHATPSTLLVVTELGRTNLDGTLAAGQIVNLWRDQRAELNRQGVTRRQYSLLSDMAFQITLAPPTADIITRAAANATDVVGNLGADGTAAWALPVSEPSTRSSILRRHRHVAIGFGVPFDGDLAKSWVLASETSFAQPTHTRGNSYYGLPTDVGTPGFRAGGALPVELSHFRPARDTVTGAVVITWSTASELNNAGFFIKRSQQKDGAFRVINPAMILGAGTTSEKRSYTYTDTTAQPNVIYYYQIEDVSLDGDRRTLTRGIRLRGHVGAADKLTTTWGDLKTEE